MFKIKTTNRHKKFWQKRKIDWDKHYLQTWSHPHRQLIVWVLQTFPWISLWEVGCGPGANIVRIVQSIPDRQIGGSDINADAIELAQKTFNGGIFHVESIENMLISDNAADVVLSDATLIYIGPWKIKKVIKEIVRVARNNIVFCEFHGTNWRQRWLLRLQTGYNAYNYKDLLEKAGCYDVQIIKIPPEFWEGFPWQPWGAIILAKIPRK